MKKSTSFKRLLLGISLNLFALLIALGVGRLVTENAAEGMNRWRNDMANDSMQVHLSADDRLLAQWCIRDIERIQQWFGERARTICPLQSTSLWSTIVRTTASQTSEEATLKRWQFDLVERDKQWRKQLTAQSASEVSATVLSELSTAEKNAGDANDQLSLERQQIGRAHV